MTDTLAAPVPPVALAPQARPATAGASAILGRMSAPEDDPRLTALRTQAAAIGGRLRAATAAVFAQLAERRVRDQKSLQAALCLSQTAVSRLLSAVRPEDPLAALAAMPGPDVLRQLMLGARKAGVDAERVTALRDAAEALEEFIEAEAGDRAVWEAILSELVPHSAAAFDARHRALAYKTMSMLKGVRAEVCVAAVVLVPGDDGTLTLIALDVLHGCRRLKPSGVLRTNTSVLRRASQDYSLTTLAGAVPASLADILLRDFSTIADDQVRTTWHDDFSDTSVARLPLGQPGTAGGADIVSAQLLRKVRRRRSGGERHISLGGTAAPPCELMVVDAWLHEEVWPGVHPEPEVFDTAIRGVANIDDPTRVNDRLPAGEPVQYLGRGPEAIRLAEYPRYAELVAHACATRSVDTARLRGYRLRLRHPIYGSQVQLSFTLPE